MITQSIKRIKKYHYSAIVPLTLIFADLWVIVFLFDLLSQVWWFFQIEAESYSLLKINILLTWILSGILTESYKVENLDTHKKILNRTIKHVGVHIIFAFALVLILGGPSMNLKQLLFLSAAIYGAVTATRLVMLQSYNKIKHKFPAQKNIIIIGNSPRGKELIKHFKATTSLPLKFYGFFDNKEPVSEDDKNNYIGKLEDVKKFCVENEINEIYYTLDQDKKFFAELSDFADEHFMFLGIIPDIGDLDLTRKVDALLVNDSRIPVIAARKLPLHVLINRQIKRIFDILFSGLVLLVLFLTVFPIIAIIIKLDSKGPILFKQLRPGRNNKLFYCYKFRTMKVGSDDSKQATKNDNRITKIGAFLRKTSLDELPQFYNVLIGDMSVVGPRPNLVKHLEEYPKEIKEYSQRHWILPGITGLSQVNGLRGETKLTEEMKKRVELDLFYVENWCLALDIKIILRTVINVIKGEDKAY
jgi:putative colanic acid biosysnthesis UDP-glucose lipid carrier transferase